jgi:hypothetical protein
MSVTSAKSCPLYTRNTVSTVYRGSSGSGSVVVVYTLIHIHSYTHTLIHSYTYTHTHTLIHSYKHTLTHSHTHTLIHFSPQHTHTYTHTHTNTHTQTNKQTNTPQHTHTGLGGFYIGLQARLMHVTSIITSQVGVIKPI